MLPKSAAYLIFILSYLISSHLILGWWRLCGDAPQDRRACGTVSCLRHTERRFLLTLDCHCMAAVANFAEQRWLWAHAYGIWCNVQARGSSLVWGYALPAAALWCAVGRLWLRAQGLFYHEKRFRRSGIYRTEFFRGVGGRGHIHDTRYIAPGPKPSNGTRESQRPARSPSRDYSYIDSDLRRRLTSSGSWAWWTHMVCDRVKSK